MNVAEAYKIKHQRLMVTARDGTELHTDVYRPFENVLGTILYRTPYNARSAIFALLAVGLAREGFAVVLQDWRGRYQSGGEINLGIEGLDGEDTLNWITEQDWWGGKIGLLGTCITSFVAAALINQCPSMPYFANVSLGGVTSLYDACYGSPGVMYLHHHLPFHYLISGKTQKFKDDVDWQVMFNNYPHSAATINCSAYVRQLFKSIREHRFRDQFWETLNSWSPSVGAVPTLFVTGTYDVWNRSTIADFEQACRQAGYRHRLILGPWDHSSLIRDLARHKQRRMGRYVLEEIIHWYKQMCIHQISNKSLVSYYLTGSEQWVDKNHWKNMRHSLFLDLSQDKGFLTATPPAPGSMSFRYDPLSPVPTKGGAVWLVTGLVPGPEDQRTLDGRGDILSFVGSPLKTPLTAAGHSSAQLWVSSSVKETHFSAKLVDLYPDGTRRIIADGITLYQGAGKLRMITIDLGPVSHVFASGHQVQLDISSSNFPKYERHFNTTTGEKAEVAVQTVVSGPSRQSALMLPDINGG